MHINIIVIIYRSIKSMDNTRKPNPLINYMRRPKLYIRLPSQGKYWDDDSLERTENNEYPVFAMTIKDELIVKTPDALLNGAATIEMVQSCIPNIKNAWKMPSIDIDAILIAIRIASTGEKMTLDIPIPGEEDTEPFEIDLRPVLDDIYATVKWEEKIVVDDITFYIQPPEYNSITNFNIATMEASKIATQLADMNDITEEQRISIVNQTVEKLANATLEQVFSTVFKISTPAGSTEDKEHIKEFFANSERKYFNAVADTLRELNNVNNDRHITVVAPPELVAKGLSETIKVPFNFDFSRFFE